MNKTLCKIINYRCNKVSAIKAEKRPTTATTTATGPTPTMEATTAQMRNNNRHKLI